MNAKAIHPIIYVRGYAMRPEEIEETVADPYMGFNIGSAKVRQLWTGQVKKYFFESPLVRLLKQFAYDDVYDQGLDRVMESAQPPAPDDEPPGPIAYRSIVIYRYYEPSSEDLGTGQKPDMQRFATQLGDLILKLRDRIYPDGAKTTISPAEAAAGKRPYEEFKVYLVAHSMGGLVCRAFLQNPEFGSADARALVDKLFTYATPHNGIEVGILGNVPSWLSLYGMNTFNRDEIAKLLALGAARENDSVDILTHFDPDRVFNLVGTNPGDYKTASGFSSLAVGDASDGLVRIKNATTRARSGDRFVQSPQAFVNRSHSGYFGIVNSEEGYQNLTRFLFGDVRADGYLDVEDLTLPPAVQEKFDAGRQIRASYIFEVAVALRGKAWELHRRTQNENSAIFRQYDELFPTNKTTNKRGPDFSASPMLFNVFVDMSQSQTGKSMAFAVDLCVRVPEYQVDGFFFQTNHFEGGYVFRDRVVIEATPPAGDQAAWKIQYGFNNQPGRPEEAKIVSDTEGLLTFTIPVVQAKPPGIKATLRVITRFWNQWQ